MRVGPFLGSWARQGALGMGRTIFLTFSLLSSSVVLAHLSSTGLRNPSGMFSWTSGRTAPFMMDSRVALSVTFASALTFAHTSDRCSWAHAACSNILLMKAISSACLALSGSCLMNSGLVGISSGGSTTLTPPLVRCCHRYIAVGSLIVHRMTSTSASPIVSHCLVTIFLKFWMVWPKASFVSSWIRVERWSKTLFMCVMFSRKSLVKRVSLLRFGTDLVFREE